MRIEEDVGDDALLGERQIRLVHEQAAHGALLAVSTGEFVPLSVSRYRQLVFRYRNPYVSFPVGSLPVKKKTEYFL